VDIKSHNRNTALMVTLDRDVHEHNGTSTTAINEKCW